MSQFLINHSHWRPP